MPFTLIVLVLAVASSYARGGRLRRIADAPLRWSWLLFAGLGLQVLLNLAAARDVIPEAGPTGYLLLLASQLLVLTWVVANWQLPGMLLVGIGLAMNALVIGANGAMPVDPEAMRALGLEGAEVPPGKHILMTDDTRLPWLADIWPLPLLRSVISVGDVVLAAGLIPLTHALMSYRSAAERRRQRRHRRHHTQRHAGADGDGA